MNNMWISNRSYHLSDKHHINISKFLSTNPTERPELRSTKPATNIPPIEPKRLEEVLSEVNNIPPIKLKDVHPDPKQNVTQNENPDNPKVDIRFCRLSQLLLNYRLN